jgi:hypothetical protein
VGLFDFFKRRRERESAIQPPTAATGTEPVVGQQVGGGELDVSSLNVQGVAGMTESLDMLAQLGPMIQKAIADGNVTIEQGQSQTIDMRGSGLREEILGIMSQHGIDPATASAGESIDAGDYGEMQNQILDALAKHGIDPGASGSSIDFRVKPDDD